MVLTPEQTTVNSAPAGGGMEGDGSLCVAEWNKYGGKKKGQGTVLQEPGSGRGGENMGSKRTLEAALAAVE